MSWSSSEEAEVYHRVRRGARVTNALEQDIAMRVKWIRNTLELSQHVTDQGCLQSKGYSAVK